MSAFLFKLDLPDGTKLSCDDIIPVMTNLARRVAAVTGVIVLVSAAPPHRCCAAADPPAAPTLAGAWRLDVEASDSARKKMDATRNRGTWGHQRTHRGGGMRDVPVDLVPPRGALDGAHHDSLAASPELRLMMRPPGRLAIEQTDSTVVLLAGGMPLEVLVVGLPQDKAGTVAPGAVHVPAAWSAGRLLAVRQDERRARASQRLELSPDGRTLTLTVAREPYEDDVPPLELKRIYVREE